MYDLNFPVYVDFLQAYQLLRNAFAAAIGQYPFFPSCELFKQIKQSETDTARYSDLTPPAI